jgi:hypothetical protein
VEDSVKPKDDTLSKLIRQFENSADSLVDFHAEADQSCDYYDGKQWTAAEIQTLQKRKQPVITDNRIADKIQYLMGLERRTRTDPKAYPRNPQDEQSAEAATDALRYVFDCNDFQQVRSIAFESMLKEGLAIGEVVRDGGKEKIRRVRRDRFYYDPHSMELDFSDATYLGIVAWLDEQRLIQRYPGHREAIEGVMSDSQRTYQETYDDKPQNVRFVDVKRRRIQVFEHYFWEGGWKRAVFFKGGLLEPVTPSPYVDEDGVPECPIIAQAAYRDRDGDPYGVVRRYKSLQDEINKRRSKALHHLSSRRVVAERGAVNSNDINKAKQEVQKPDGWLEVTPGMKVEIENNTDIGQAQFNLLVDAINALNSTGPNLAMQGQTGNISGRAKQLDQEGGAIQVGALFDQIRHWQKRIARATWNRIKQFWREEKWIRVTDDEQKLRFVGLNVPVVQDTPYGPMVAGRQNDVAAMHMDIIIDEAPDTVTLQQEQFEILSNLIGSGVAPPGPNTLEVLIEASSLRNKQRLIEKLKGGGEVSPEQQQAMQEQQAMQKAMAVAEIRGAEAKAAKTEAEVVKVTQEVQNNALAAQASAEKTGADIAKVHSDIRKSAVESAVMVHNATKPQEAAASQG